MKRSEIIKIIKKRLQEADINKFKETWNIIFEEEQISNINKKDKDYFIDLFEDEVSLVDSQNLIKAYRNLKM